jgi:hypothetical protein
MRGKRRDGTLWRKYGSRRDRGKGHPLLLSGQAPGDPLRNGRVGKREIKTLRSRAVPVGRTGTRDHRLKPVPSSILRRNGANEFGDFARNYNAATAFGGREWLCTVISSWSHVNSGAYAPFRETGRSGLWTHDKLALSETRTSNSISACHGGRSSHPEQRAFSKKSPYLLASVRRVYFEPAKGPEPC